MNRRRFLRLGAMGAALSVWPRHIWAASNSPTPGRPTIAAYYFPNYHPGDPRNERQKGRGWSEWELLKAAKPRFPGHAQPRVPAWGYTDEANPKAMAQKIDAAADHGLDAFIFDWYHYDDGPFLEGGLEKGFLKARNRRRLRFALMWANHDYPDIFPASGQQPPKTLYPGVIKPETWERMTDYIIAKYFKHPSHWLIDGKPYFSIYEVQTLARGFGSLEATRAALDRFRAKTKTAGLPGLHLNAVMWGQPVLPGEAAPRNPAELVKLLGFDSVSSYVWVHHAQFHGFPTSSYEALRDDYLDYARRAFSLYGVPYYPNATVGWDSTPRTDQSGPFENRGYPYTAVITGNTPVAFRESLKILKDLLEARPREERVLSLNAWNEWTEGSYLEPDTVQGMKYLEAIRDVFGTR